MPPTVAVIATGAMGAAIGARLHENGVRVISLLDGRSEASRKRAADAGIANSDEAGVAAADVILSVVPPGEAVALAKRLAPALTAATHKPLYADCNAINPQTMREIESILRPAGCDVVDGGIIGGPPRENYRGPAIYVSGKSAPRLETLNAAGLFFRAIDGDIGAASALKMSYGGITKGLTALGSAMILAAERAGVADAFHAELADSQPAVFAFLKRHIPGMYQKAYRWVAEMDEVGASAGGDAEARIYRGLSEFFDRIAQDEAGAKQETDRLRSFLLKDKPAAP